MGRRWGDTDSGPGGQGLARWTTFCGRKCLLPPVAGTGAPGGRRSDLPFVAFLRIRRLCRTPAGHCVGFRTCQQTQTTKPHGYSRQVCPSGLNFGEVAVENHRPNAGLRVPGTCSVATWVKPGRPESCPRHRRRFTVHVSPSAFFALEAGGSRRHIGQQGVEMRTELLAPGRTSRDRAQRRPETLAHPLRDPEISLPRIHPRDTPQGQYTHCTIIVESGNPPRGHPAEMCLSAVPDLESGCRQMDTFRERSGGRFVKVRVGVTVGHKAYGSQQPLPLGTAAPASLGGGERSPCGTGPAECRVWAPGHLATPFKNVCEGGPWGLSLFSV